MDSSLIGQRFGRITVVSKANVRDSFGHIMYICKCTCGNMFTSFAVVLNSGRKKSCGCLHAQKIRPGSTRVAPPLIDAIPGELPFRFGCEKACAGIDWSDPWPNVADPNGHKVLDYVPEDLP